MVESSGIPALPLTPHDLERVAGALVSYGYGERAGPVAMVVHSALNLDLAVLLKQRVGDRPFRILTEVGAARSWLASCRQSCDPDAPGPRPGRRGRGLRPGCGTRRNGRLASRGQSG
jgi:hypothetical protein